MLFNTILLSLVGATALATPTSQTITANYDDITVIPALPLANNVHVYKGLNYTNFAVAQVLTGIKLKTTPNCLVTGFEQTTLAGGQAGFQKTGKTKDFDLKSFFFSCAANTATGAAAVAQQCTILVRGYRKIPDTHPVAQQKITFDPAITNVFVPQKKAVFGDNWKNISRVQITMLESTTGELLNVFDMDSMTYVVHQA